ncbi:MAG TPA: winged helix-turn-helix domain-containing protein [Solirubrobacterales bacterium]|nr:winged helix-turn-helix domain-containing protein [Solirubrobacterales bacterium]
MKGALLREAGENRLLAMAHSLRVDAFKILTQREASPSEITRELGLPQEELNRVTYHVKHLVELGCAEVVGKRREHGKRPATVYKATARSIIEMGEWDQFKEENPGLADHILCELMQVQLDDYATALQAGTIGADEHFHMTRTPRVLDLPGLEQALELKEEHRRRMDEIERESAERRAGDGSDAIPVSDSLAFFKLPPRTGANSRLDK